MSTSRATIPPYFCDVQTILQRYVAQVGSNEASYEAFVKVWNDLNFSCMHFCNSPYQSSDDFLQSLYQAAILFLEHPATALGSSTVRGFASTMKSGDSDQHDKDILRRVQSGCIFLLHGLFATQPVENRSKLAARVTLDSEKCMHDISSRGGDVEKAYNTLVQEGGLRIVAGPRHGPALAPNTLEKERRARYKEWTPQGFRYSKK